MGRYKRNGYSHDAIRPPKSKSDRVYPCSDCGKLRSKEEGGTTFTVCDECWDKAYGKKGAT